MLKIIYPDCPKELHKDYLKNFDVDGMQNDLDTILADPRYNNINRVVIEDLLVGSIEEILKVAFEIKSVAPTNNDLSLMKRIFNYDSENSPKKHQSNISTFFSNKRDQIKLDTCYFCNIDYITSFSVLNEYGSGIDFIKYASISELEAIKGVGVKKRKYLQSVDFNKITDIDELELSDAIKNRLKSIDGDLRKGQFTLDHLLNKADYPLLALSLYNFVPSCYACNSKFKRDSHLIESSCDSFLSPTSENFSFSDEVKFELFYQDLPSIDSIDDFDMWLTPKIKVDEYSKYIRTFKLNTRYNTHKNDALDLIVKHRIYSPDKIREIASMLNLDVLQVKRHIFGDELFVKDDCEVPKSKFKKDIAENINLIIDE